MSTDWRIEAVESAPELLAVMHGECFEYAWDAQTFVNLLRTPGTLAIVVCADGAVDEPAGFAVYRLVGDEAEVITLGVRPGWRQRGAGAALLHELARRAGSAGAGSVVLEAAVDNDAALALYRRAGFATKGSRPRYYRRSGGNVDAFIMRRSL